MIYAENILNTFDVEDCVTGKYSKIAYLYIYLKIPKTNEYLLSVPKK